MDLCKWHHEYMLNLYRNSSTTWSDIPWSRGEGPGRQVVPLNLITNPLLPMPYRLFCAIYGENTTFAVNIDETQTVDELKKRIKAEKDPELASYAADSFTLYKVNINISKEEIYAEVMEKIKQSSITDDRKKMVPAYELSDYWEESNPPKKTIHILVQLPRGESIGLICGAVA
jgi:hypothetical protein